MKSFALWVALLTLAPYVHAAEKPSEKNGIARVLLASGTTTYSGKKIVENEILSTIGVLKTGTEGGAKLKLTGNDVVLEVAANSEINLVLPPSGDPSESIELIRGKVRVRVPKAKDAEKAGTKSDKPRFLLRHKKVTMGVRGTDFLAIASDELDETELVVFNGEVEFGNDKAPSETQMVKPGNWSAIGGRFGDRIHAPMKLSKSGLEYFEQMSRDTPAYNVQAVPVEKTPEGAQTSAPGH
jgi:ferric-dicitrate binding protein FerR (iron transport regulator)